MNPVGGSKIFIGLRVASKSEVTASDFVGQDWVEIGGLTNIGQLGDSQEVVSQAVISGGRTRQTKGTVVGQVMENTFLPIWNDPGQARFMAAVKSCHTYAFKVEWSQGCEDDPVVDLFYGFALPGARAGGDSGTAQLRNGSIAVDSNVVEKLAEPFDYFVDPENGNDANAGTSPDAPKKTVSSISQAASLRIGVKRGTVSRETVSLNSPGMSLGAYGEGQRPAFIGSTKIETTWAAVGGNVWSTPLASAPTNIYLVTAVRYDGIAKLTRNTGTPTTPSAGQWGHSSGTAYIYSTTDPNTLHYERATASTVDNITYAAADIRADGIASFMAARNGTLTSADRVIQRNCDVSWNCNDNFNGVVAKNFLIENCFSWGPGTSAAKSSAGGDGDCISFHGDGGTGYSSGVIRYCDIRYGRKSGIGNQTACITESYGNFIDECYYAIASFPVTYTGGVPMTNRHAYNIIRRSDADGYGIHPGNPTHAISFEIDNHTIYSSVATASQGGIMVNYSAIGGANLTMAIRNSIVKGFARGIDSRDNAAALVIENVCVNGNTTNYFDNGTRTPALSTVPVASLTSDPLFVDAGNQDFRLQAGSPCIGAGKPLGFTQDQAHNPVPPTPDIGALQRQS